MKNKEYIMVGAPIITKEIFRKVLIPLNNYSFKPSGGFWSSIYIDNIGISDWFSYLQDARGIAVYKNLNQSTIFTLKDSAKILTIDTLEKVLELAQKYQSYHQIQGFYSEITNENKIFDFGKLSQDYDGIYIDYNKFINQNQTIVFDNLSVNSLLLFNLDCIKEYRKAHITFDLYNPYSIPYIKQDDIGVPKIVEEESYEHKFLSQKTQELYLNVMNNYLNYTFKDYNEYLNTVTQNIKKVINILELEEIKKINEITKYLQDKGMYTKTEQIIQNIVLNYISEYLLQDENRIISLPKTKTIERKKYPIY